MIIKGESDFLFFFNISRKLLHDPIIFNLSNIHSILYYPPQINHKSGKYNGS